MWVDEQTKRVLRVEVQNNDIPRGFPITLAENAIEYDFVDVAGERYLMPVRAGFYWARSGPSIHEERHRVRNYHKFETDVQILAIQHAGKTVIQSTRFPKRSSEVSARVST